MTGEGVCHMTVLLIRTAKGHPELTVTWGRSQYGKHFFFLLQFKFLHRWICFSKSYLLLVWDFSVSLTHLYSLSKLSGIGRAQSLKITYVWWINVHRTSCVRSINFYGAAMPA